MAKGDTDENVRLAAIDHLMDQEALISIAQNDPSIRVKARASIAIADEAVQVRIAIKDEEGFVGGMIAANLKNQNHLKEIALNAVLDSVKLEAVQQLKDQPILADLLRSSRVQAIRAVAASRIEDVTVIVNLAKNDPEQEVRLAATENSKLHYDQNVLADLAGNAKDPKVRSAAIEYVSDQSLLEKIEQDDPDPDVRRAAQYRISRLKF